VHQDAFLTACRQGFDLTSKTVSLGQHNGSSGAPQSLQYDLLVAADGSGSQAKLSKPPPL